MTQLVFVTDEQILRKLIREEIAGTPKESKPEYEIAERMGRRQAAKFLEVSYQTMHNWTRSGVLKEHGQGRKKFYLRPELIEALRSNS